MVKKFKKFEKESKDCIKKKFKYSLSLISPFCFTKTNSFIYNIKIYKKFKKYANSYNNFKLNEEEKLFLSSNIENIKDSFNILGNKNYSNLVSDYFQKLFPYIEKINEKKSKIIEIIEEIMINRKKQENISLLKIKEILKNKYNISKSKSTIYRLIKNKLRYRYRKTLIKNKSLDELKYKIISFIFIKIIVRAMKLNLNFVFIDESHFSLVNNHYKTWIREGESLHYGPKEKKKINIILAISINKIINFELIKENINKNNFKQFLETTISKMNENELENSIFVMDNFSVHCCKKIIKLMKRKKLKVLFTVPYESYFNPIELAFRYIKNIIYKKIYLNLRNLKKDVIEILTKKDIEEALFKNFIETLRKYKLFVDENININLD